ncbi:MAG: cadmium resistance transporter [Flaviflexus sp.]|uniref:cadmium resistance transporter n=1 Tax=Flaviflexus sp. TaxID=1969482 RepID=UPI00352C2799
MPDLMSFLGVVLQGAGLFLVTNIDHLIVLTVLFGHWKGQRGLTRRIMAGQYLGFGAMLAIIIVVALGAGWFIPQGWIRFFGLIPLLLGLHAAWKEIAERRERKNDDDDDDEAEEVIRKTGGNPASIPTIAAITFANCGDEIGIYLPVFAVVEPWQIAVYVAVFALGVAGLVYLARSLVGIRGIDELLEKWEGILFPAVLIILGVTILMAV